MPDIHYPVVWRLIVLDGTTWKNFGQIVAGFTGFHSFDVNYLEVQPVDTDTMRQYPMGFKLNPIEFTISGFEVEAYGDILQTGTLLTIRAECNGIVDPASGAAIIRGYEVVGTVKSYAEDFSNNQQSVKLGFQPNSSKLYTRVAGVLTTIHTLPGSGIALPAMPPAS